MGKAVGNAVVWKAVMGSHADSLREFFGRLLADGAGDPRSLREFTDRCAGEPGADRAAATPVRDLEAALAFAERLGGRVERPGGAGSGEGWAVVRGPGGGRVVLRAADPI